MKSLVKILIVAGGILVALNGCMFFVQPSMVFIPSTNLAQTPADWGLNYREVYLQSDANTRIHGWYITRQRADKVVLFFHGNAGNISHRSSTIKLFHQMGFSVLIIDYRGYGKSQGVSDEDSFYQDALVAWQYLQKKLNYKASQIIVFGRSLGGAAAIDLASKHKPALLIVESTFSSARDQANRMMPLLSKLVVLRFSFNSHEKIAKVSCPVLIIHSPEDEIIAYDMGQKLFRAAREPKQFVTIQGDHNTGHVLSRPHYENSIRQFLRKHLATSRSTQYSQ